MTTPAEKATAGDFALRFTSEKAYVEFVEVGAKAAEACYKISPSDPLRAAEAIGEAFAYIQSMAKQFVTPEEFDAHGVAIEDADWESGFQIAVAEARALLSRLQGGQ